MKTENITINVMSSLNCNARKIIPYINDGGKNGKYSKAHQSNVLKFTSIKVVLKYYVSNNNIV